ncbi:hypothetical protein, partial [Salmonella enterica]|uniref:hypothetical protein n=1 Tax=Salmonella enterica TaxID=28901 RepID=UPI001C71FAEF
AAVDTGLFFHIRPYVLRGSPVRFCHDDFLLLMLLKNPPEDDLCDSNKKGRKNMRPLITVS